MSLAPAVPAASPRLRIEDGRGDANGLNSQGEYGTGDVEAPTEPASVAAADIVQVDLMLTSRVSTLTFGTAAPAADGFAYTLTAELGGCRLYLRHERLDGTSATYVYGCGNSGRRLPGRDVAEGARLRIPVPPSLARRVMEGTLIRAETQMLFDAVAFRPTPLFVDTAAP